MSSTNTEDDAASAISSEAGREVEPEGEETETAPEGEGDDEDSVTRCIWWVDGYFCKNISHCNITIVLHCCYATKHGNVHKMFFF